MRPCILDLLIGMYIISERAFFWRVYGPFSGPIDSRLGQKGVSRPHDQAVE